jgi:hypothetical protein
MDSMGLPESPSALTNRLIALRLSRLGRNALKRQLGRDRRKPLKPSERALILSKTDGRCHICGGKVGAVWEADHVLSNADGGGHSPENYLAAHALCNNYRWDYSSEEFQWILKIGVWARKQMENGGNLGGEMCVKFHAYETQRERRRVRAT